MILLRWTGLGWLWLPIFVVSLGTAAAVASAVGSEGAGRDPVPILVAMAVVLALSPVQWFVGTALNSKAGPDGDRHTVMDAPMEYTAIGQAGVAVALAALVVGQLVSAWGWALFGGILVSALVAVLVVQERRRLRRRLDAVSDRE